MHLKLIAVVGFAAALSAGCKCSPDGSKSSGAERARASQEATGKSAPRAHQEVDSGTSHQITLSGNPQSYTVHLPDQGKGGAKPPVLVLLLDHGQTAERFTDKYNVIRGAKKLGYLLALLTPPGGKRARWDHGLCSAGPGTPDAGSAALDGTTGSPKSSGRAADAPTAAPPKAAPVSSIELVKAVIEDLGEQHQIDDSRITVFGVGEGAAMAHRVAAELPSITSAAVFNPRVDCRTPSAPIQPERGRSVLVFSGGSPTSGSDAGSPSPALERLVFDAWTAAGKCDPTAEKRDDRKGTVTTTRSCEGGTSVRLVEDPSTGESWPVRIAGTYTMRALHNFLAQN